MKGSQELAGTRAKCYEMDHTDHTVYGKRILPDVLRGYRIGRNTYIARQQAHTAAREFAPPTVEKHTSRSEPVSAMPETE